jgi:hypothetical protein
MFINVHTILFELLTFNNPYHDSFEFSFLRHYTNDKEQQDQNEKHIFPPTECVTNDKGNTIFDYRQFYDSFSNTCRPKIESARRLIAEHVSC